MTAPRNLIVVMSDEHNPKVMGCSGHPVIATPNLDALAARGTRFTSAYTTSPVCVPARAAFAIGKYIHQIGFWDNADAYDGSVPTWHHVLRDGGHEVVSIGKLHFRASDEDHGFSEEQVPMHILGGKGDLMGLVRDELPRRGGAKKMAALAKPGESSYTLYDREICARAQVWLRENAARAREKPWVLFVSFVAPHFPLTAPPEHFYRYYDQSLPMPKLYAREQRPRHPYLEDYRNSFCYDDYFESEEDVRRALSGYFGLVSFFDENLGKILNVVSEMGLAGSTDVIYTSDHGDNLGARGLWGKSTMYEEIAGVPMICAGPSFPKGRVVSTPVSHVDVFPTVLEVAGESFLRHQDGRPGVSLVDLATGAQPERTVLSEYHGMGSSTAAYMIRVGRYKYVHYCKYAPQLFDLEADPEETIDLASDLSMGAVLADCRRRLEALLDPDAVDRRARARQAELLEANGGREAVIARGDLGFTPAPGVAADFQ
ncbi:sulfatase-like hydrolase/transferase [Piscinibacter sakaiensis]|uniref:Choline-sulfatase n=1 Tax=Piscinibacter sakaiensis TaxID=1547922 RepID=A0A0K8P6I8_PISS1|nr:sulfatase-like hydrolase/transferase [Piscinibacter sakaiensis]GAP37825.1 choline-sulfatase [Piscinibacter sakaiensis]